MSGAKKPDGPDEEAPSTGRVEGEADQEETPSDFAELALRLFGESRSEKRREYDVEKAMAAFKRMSGSVSHGSLAQNIDEELYGPMGHPKDSAE